jgi:hypothetical protein
MHFEEELQTQITKSTGFINANPFPQISAVPSDAALVAQHIDHTLLKPDATPAQIKILCDEAVTHKFKVT